jgi:hypothetical protein
LERPLIFPLLRYGQLRSDTLLFADGFANKHKLKQGDVILIFSPNSIHYPIPLFGGQAAGLTVSTANSGYTPPELAHQIRNSESKIVIVSSDLLPVALKALKEKDVSVKEDKVFVLPGADGDIKVEGGAKSWEELRGKKGFKPIKVTDKTKLAKFPACEFFRCFLVMSVCLTCRWRPTILKRYHRAFQRSRHLSFEHGRNDGGCTSAWPVPVFPSTDRVSFPDSQLRPTGLSNKDDKILAVLVSYPYLCTS